jgi:hypothetical protein
VTKDGKPRASPPSQGRIRSFPYQGIVTKDGKPRASPPITREDQIITIPRIVTKDGKPRASPSPPLTTQQANHNDHHHKEAF